MIMRPVCGVGRSMFASLLTLLCIGFTNVASEPQQVELNLMGDETYFVDVSYPIWSDHLSTNYDWLPHNQNASIEVPDEYKGMPIQRMGDKNAFYNKIISGCRDKYGGVCDQLEKSRWVMSRRQPQSMRNYTELGFKKIKAPEPVFQLLKEFWEENYKGEKVEKWGKGYPYVNHWDQPTYMVSLEDLSLKGAGTILKNMVWDAAESTMEEWTGQELAPCSLYGIRVYKEGAILATHVDRLPLVTSAIINVAQDVDEPWPIEVYGHDGKAYNITMEPGDMVLYESHSVLHGRPFPLKGRYYANVFVHFEPLGAIAGTCRNEDECEEQATKDGGLPPYVIPGSPEESTWRQQNPGGWKPMRLGFNGKDGSTASHLAAREGDMHSLRKIAKKNKKELLSKDKNGWKPIHEAARTGHADIIEFLVENGEKVDARTGSNVTPLKIAIDQHGENHEVCALLRKLEEKPKSRWF